jgi:hypothetical protein
MADVNKGPAAVTPNFIRDVAATEDSFGPHQRLADAIAEVVEQNSDVKVIGLLGPWGSGKSTVVKLVESRLHAPHEGTRTYHVFAYDAWLHQSDPPRRAFLESLVTFLSQKGISNDATWREDLDRLNGKIEDTTTTSTPTLTSAGRAIFISLFLVPIGAVFAGHEWYHDFIWSPWLSWTSALYVASILCVASPLLVASWLYLKWRPRKSPFARAFWKRKNWTTHDATHQEESILSLFMNRQITKNKSRVLRDPEPTAIEFQQIFRKMMDSVSTHKQDSKDKQERHLVIVIDNLDRLPVQDALAMWGTIRSFFLGAETSDHNGEKRAQPTILLPIDESAIEGLFTNDAAAVAASFMAKTFDLTFRISKPVLSSWDSYLTKQMKHVFGDIYEEEWSQITSRFYHRLESSSAGLTVTPRSVNKLVNELATSWLQWKSMASIKFASVAYYCVFRTQIEEDIVRETLRPIAGIADLDPNWARSIAALHFGVEPDEAQQALIGQPLRNAIQAPNLDEFSKLSQIKGFSLILNGLIAQWREENSNDPERILKLVSLISNSSFRSNGAVASIWRSLRHALRDTHTWKSFDVSQSEALITLTPSSGSDDRKEFVELIGDRVEKLDDKATNSPGFVGAFAGLWKGISTGEAGANDLPAQIWIPGQAANYFEASEALDGNSMIRGLLKTHCHAPELIALIGDEVTKTTDAERTIKRFERVKSKFKDIDIQTFMQSLANLVRQAPSGSPSVLASAKILGALRKLNQNAIVITDALCTEGHIASRLTAAVQQNDLRLTAVLLSIFYCWGQNFDVPEPDSWAGKFHDHPDLAKNLSIDLLDFSPEKTAVVTRLVDAARTNNRLRPISAAVFSYRVGATAIGPLPVQSVIENLGQYLELLEPPVKDAFVTALTGYTPVFWADMNKLPLEGNVSLIFSTLLRADGETSKKAAEWLEKRLEALSTDEWKASLQTANSPYQLVRSLQSLSGDPVGFEELRKALNESIPAILMTSDEPLRKRWFEITQILEREETITLFRYAADQICGGAKTANIAQLISVGGNDFLQEGDFVGSADKSVRHVILPALSDDRGLEILLEHASVMRDWVKQGDANTSSILAKRLEDGLSAAEDSKKRMTRELASALGVEINVEEQSPSTPPEES